jgi:hypothetical protein
MKLAEALILRADYQKRIEQVRQRIYQNAKLQEGDQPDEDPQGLLAQFESMLTALTKLIQQINRTNSTTPFDATMMLSDALALRDELRLRHDTYRTLAQNASTRADRYSRTEIKVISSVNVAEIQQQADLTAQLHRELDTKLQALNWTTDLVE